MKARYRQILADIKTATRLGHPEALEAAFTLLVSLPEVASNRQLSAGFIEQVIHPAGEILAQLPVTKLRPLSTHPLAAVRAVGAAALGRRYLNAGDVPAKLLRRLAQDARIEVRETLSDALAAVTAPQEPRLRELLAEWLTATSPRLRAAALHTLPALAPFEGELLLEWIRPLGADHDPNVRAALAETLTRLASLGQAPTVLNLLNEWANDPHPNDWVIARALSSAWGAQHPQEVKAILGALFAQRGKTKALSNAVQALARHGLEIQLE